ncbi:MAG: serine hydrolase [Chloroflexi bacterium]|nr:serine hydrolase [Chloroflexota bacterium]
MKKTKQRKQREIEESVPVSTIDQYANQVRNDFNVPGLAVAIVKDDTIVLAKGYGVRKLGNTQPVTENSLFGIASISKSFTAMALGLLVDEGKLKWNDPVTKYIPSFQLYDSYATREVTILDLLVHRTGLASVSGGTMWYGSDYDRSEVVHRLRYLKPVSSFRSEFAYQNNMYLVAGQIIPALTGKSWDEFVAERIFTPLEMHSSNTSIKAFDLGSDVFQPHAIINGKLQVVEPRNYDNVGPAASINTTALELAAYVRLLLKGGQYKDQQLYSAEIAHDLWTPHTLIPIPKEYPTEYRSLMPQFHYAYALGWIVQDYQGKGQRKVSHSGGIDGMRSLLTMIPEKNLGIVALANNEGPAPWILTNIILNLYWGATKTDWYDVAQKEWKQKSEKRSQDFENSYVPNTLPSLDLKKYVGRYYSELYGDIEIKIRKELLSLHFFHTTAFTAQLTHWHYDTFRIEWQDPIIPDGLLAFVLDAHGQIKEICLEQMNLLDVDFSELHPIKRIGG